MPSKANLVLYQGDDYSAVVTVLNSEGDPADLTGYEVAAHIREGPADKYPDITAEMATLVGKSVVLLALPSSVTVALTGSQYLWDLELTSPGGIVTTILAGAVNITPEITRPVGAVKKRSALK